MPLLHGTAAPMRTSGIGAVRRRGKEQGILPGDTFILGHGNGYSGRLLAASGSEQINAPCAGRQSGGSRRTLSVDTELEGDCETEPCVQMPLLAGLGCGGCCCLGTNLRQ